MPIGLYIHVPFCKRKCPYCDFYSLVLSKDTEKLYADAVVRNIERYKGTEIDTVYFGGGTPSLLSAHSFYIIMNAIKNNLILSSDAEISLECNPSSADSKKLKSLHNIGFNRISFGIQSCVDSELKALGRLHNFNEAKNAVIMAHKSGFDNISADLMLGIIGQTKESLEFSVDELSKLPLTHISAYILKIEEATPYNNPKIISAVPDEDTTADLYTYACEALSHKSFLQYEISNFSKAHYECTHNLKYWLCEEYIGIGPSAHSFWGGKRFEVPRDINSFINSDKQTEIINEEHPHTFDEVAMLRLRLSSGLSRKVCEQYSQSFDSILKKAQPMKKAGLVDFNDDCIFITQKGFLVSNTIITDLIF